MNRKSTIIALLIFVSATGAQPLQAEDSPGKFVADFYDWYVPMISHTHSASTTETAIRKKASGFSPELSKALREDAAAQAKSPNDIVGLDWDPFLNSQEQIDRCVIGNTTEKNGAFRVDIYDVLEGKKEKKPSIIAEVKKEDGHWLFVNFWRTDGGDLLSDLRQLRKSRQHHGK